MFLLAPPVGENETDETQQRDERRAGGLEPCGIDRQESLPGEFAPDGPAERLRCGEVLPVGAACRDGRAFRAVRMLPDEGRRGHRDESPGAHEIRQLRRGLFEGPVAVNGDHHRRRAFAPDALHAFERRAGDAAAVNRCGEYGHGIR